MALMTQEIAMMLYGSSKRLRISHHERGSLLAEKFSSRLSEALRLQQEMEKEGTLSQALAIRDNNVSSETAVRWQETRMLKLATFTL